MIYTDNHAIYISMHQRFVVKKFYQFLIARNEIMVYQIRHWGFSSQLYAIEVSITVKYPPLMSLPLKKECSKHVIIHFSVFSEYL